MKLKLSLCHVSSCVGSWILLDQYKSIRLEGTSWVTGSSPPLLQATTSCNLFHRLNDLSLTSEVV